MTEYKTMVVPLSAEPGQDIYWHDWAVIEFDATVFDFEGGRKIEKVISSVKYEEYDEDTDEEIDVKIYLDKLAAALRVAGYVGTIKTARLAFPGE